VPTDAAAFIAKFIAEVIRIVTDLFCKKWRGRERERERGRGEKQMDVFSE